MVLAFLVFEEGHDKYPAFALWPAILCGLQTWADHRFFMRLAVRFFGLRRQAKRPVGYL